MMCRFTIWFICFLSACYSNAQRSNINRDTSFTIQSAYLKEKKKFPFIEIASPLSTKNVAVKKEIVYSNVDNRKLHLDIYYPTTPSTQKRIGVLLVHGGGWKSGDKSQNEAMAFELAANGFVAVSAEYRLSPEAKYPAAIKDLRKSIEWMRVHAKKYNLNKKQRAALGVSAGGQLAALLGTTNKHKKSAVQAVVDIDGVLAFHHPESEEGKVAAEWLDGSFEENPTNWLNASALTHAGKSRVPFLFINSSNPRFHAGQNDFLKKVEPYKIYTEVNTLPNTPHTFWLFHPWFTKTVELTIRFLGKVFQ